MEGAVALNDFNDGTVLYIDPNDPQAAALLQQAGLTITEDGTVIGGIDENVVQQQQEVDAAAHQVQGEPQVISAEAAAAAAAENQLGSMMEGTDDASVGVPQELFMNSEELDTKENILEAAAAAAAESQQSVASAVELGTTLVST